MEHPDDNTENVVLNARDLYVLMRKGCRISRNIRASWFFKHLNSVLPFSLRQEEGDVSEELSVVSVVPTEEGMHLDPDKTYSVYVASNTIVTFLASRYKMVFALDLSPSIISVNISEGCVIYDELMLTVSECMNGLVKPFQIPGSSIVMCPELYVTVVVQTPLVLSKTNQVLIQGMLVTQDSVDLFLEIVQKELSAFEHELSHTFTKILDMSQAETMKFVDTPEDSEDRTDMMKEDLIFGPEAAFVNLLRYGILALQLLPENSSAAMVVISDNMVALPDASLLESLLSQLRKSTIACSFFKIGSAGACCLHHQFGHVPHIQLMQFIATATFGAYFGTLPKLEPSDSMEPNVYHKAMYFWNFQKGLEGFKYELTYQSDTGVPGSLAWIHRLLYGHPLEGRSFVADQVRKKHLEKIVPANMASVLWVRLREGYTIKEIAVTKDGSQLEVKLVLPWRDYTRIEYYAVSAWPLNSSHQQTSIEIWMEGNYEFQHEITCANQNVFKSPYRTINVKRFWQTLQGIRETDQLLAHLQSFFTNPVYYKIPESIKIGIPLFYLSQNSQTPALNSQLSTKDTVLAQFASFWKPVIMLDTNIWQKWMHTHRIGLVLEHDMPLPKYLHIPNSSGRFNNIQCRQAITSLNLSLRNWSTFVLMENHSYIKLLYSEADKPPLSFCVLRVTSKPPSMVLRLAFLSGTPASVREQQMKQLQGEIQNLKFPPRGQQKTDKVKGSPNLKAESSPVRKPPLLRDWSEIHCCTVLVKPVEKIFIRYERQPRDMLLLDDPNKDIVVSGYHSHLQIKSSSKSAASMFNMLSCYLNHKRWVWSVQKNSMSTINMQAISRVLMTLAKIRLQEGFHFAITKSGIVNMVLEVDMMDPGVVEDAESDSRDNAEKKTCVIQYIIFPPYNKTSRSSVSEDDMDEMETTEADGELQIVTECWVEPQFGVSLNNTPERKHLDGLNYKEIAKAFFPVDCECISSLITFEHLIDICQNNAVFPSDSSDAGRSSSTCPPLSPKLYRKRDEKKKVESSIQCIPFPFDPLSLLPRCQQAELLFSTFIVGDHPDISEVYVDPKSSNGLLFSILFENLMPSDFLGRPIHDREIILSTEDCVRFLELLKARKRDLHKHPYPFSLGVDGQDGFHDQTDSTLKDDDEAQTESSARTSGQPVKKPEESSKPSVSEETRIPMWRCFSQAKSSTHLFLTFVPASFDDLLLLNKCSLTSTCKAPSQEQESSQEQASACNEDKPQDADVSQSGEEESDQRSKSYHHHDASENAGQDASSAEIHADGTSPVKTSDPSKPSEAEDHSLPDINVKNPDSNLSSQPPGPLMVPVYVYDCYQYNVMDSLVNKWGFTLAEDIYEDMSFDLTYVDSVNDSYGKLSSSPRGRLLSFDAEEVSSEDREESDINKLHWRSSVDRKSYESMCEAGVWDFRRHCVLVSEIFFSSFVSGVYKSLHQNYYIDWHDVNAAINTICEESLPLESEMTSFLLSSCTHFQHIVDSARRDLRHSSDVDRSAQKLSVRFVEHDDMDDGSSDKTPAVLQLPKTSFTLNFPLVGSNPCETQTGLRDLVMAKFMDMVQKWFRPIPSHPDYYYFYPQIVQETSILESSTSGSSDVLEEFTQQDLPEDVEFIDIEEISPKEEDRERTKSSSTVSNASSGEVSSSQSEDEEALVGDYKEQENPLFIHFTCSMKSSRDSHFASVQTLPQCMVDVWRHLDSDVHELDLASLKFTFDIICMTLPTELDVPLPRKPSFIRLLSSGSNPPQPAQDGDAEENSTSLVLSDPGLINPFSGDPVHHLPRSQHFAISQLKEEIEWLLFDEITSSLRHMHPLNSDALRFVTENIRASAGKPSCVHNSVKLEFVYGADPSLCRFTEEFERMQIPGYHLTKEGDFYFAILNRAHFSHFRELQPIVDEAQQSSNIKHAMALQTALVELSSKEGTPAEREGRTTEADKMFPAIEERSYSLPSILLSMGTSEDQSSPLAVSSPKKLDSQILENRQRHSSDGRDMKVKTDARLVGPMMDPTVDDFRQLPIPASSMLDIPLKHDETVEHAEGLLKKSSSFGGSGFGGFPMVIGDSVGGERQLVNVIAPIRSQLALERNRHSSAPSAQGTHHSLVSTQPQTPSWISSQGSYNEDGYDGDSSDAELDDTASTSESTQAFPLLPHFWLILQIHSDRAEIFFHARETGHEESAEKIQHKELLEKVCENIQQICMRINQQLLLKDLYDTRMCNSLLVPEADEDVHWTDKRTTSGRSIQDTSGDEDDSEMEGQPRSYLFASLTFKPGKFACNCIWTKHFVLHSRLKATTAKGVSKGYLALRSVLNKFSVNNRKNMFVIQETSTGSVFYARLKEIHGGHQSDETVSLEGSLNRASFPLAKQESEIQDTGTIDTDSVSVTSTVSRLSTKEDDYLQLLVYGIQEIGQEIHEDLVKILQKKLDDAVLDAISVMLSRNPMCKLKPEDVHFIQTPKQEPTEMFQLTIPGHAMMYLLAVMYYLRQNLLHFLHRPNYVDTSPDGHFREFVQGIWSVIPSENVYLYIKPQTVGGKGIACISLRLVDGMCNPVKLLSCPHPYRSAANHIQDVSEFNSLLEITEHQANHSPSKPGPTALIQFKIWERGSVDMKTLKDRLITTIKQALCDIVTEYNMLTAPICQIPRHLLESFPLPVCSVPTSPTSPFDAACFKDGRRTMLSRKHSDSFRFNPASNRPAIQSASPFHSVKEASMQKTRVTSPPPESKSVTFDWSSPALDVANIQPSPTYTDSSSEKGVQELVSLYECGDRGSLSSVFVALIKPWLTHCTKLGLPSVYKLNLSLLCHFSVDYVLQENLGIINGISSKINPKVFKLVKSHSSGDGLVGKPYHPCRPPLRAAEDSRETSLDLGTKVLSDSDHKSEFLLIGRDVEQWRLFVPCENADDVHPSVTMPAPKTFQAVQKFLPYMSPEGEDSKSLEAGTQTLSQESYFVPRQNLLVIHVDGLQLSVFAYNWASDLTSQLEDKLSKLVKWSNARALILQSIISQKKGLYHHAAFADVSYTQEQNQFTQSSSDIDSLIKYPAPPQRETQRRHSSTSTKDRNLSRIISRFRPFDETFRNLQPPRPLYQTIFFKLPDPVVRHGMQTQELRSHLRQDTERLFRLQQLYFAWLRKNNSPVSEDYVHLLKCSSRLFHYCVTPLLFSPQWRQRVIEKTMDCTVTNIKQEMGVTVTPPPVEKAEGSKSRSRHSSGTSIASLRNRRSDSQDRRKASITPQDSPEIRHRSAQEDSWHVELRSSFINQYRSYLEVLGFVVISVQESARKRYSSSKSVSPTGNPVTDDKLSNRYSLQKTFTSGIMFVEIGFREEYFCVKMFVLTCMQIGISVNQQMNLLFVDECEKCKDLIHVHSFAHDFHLRLIQRYLSGEDCVFSHCFHLTHFLQDFARVYPYPPAFSRNWLQQDIITIPDLPCPSHELYDYMLKQMKQRDMRVIRMVVSIDTDLEPDYIFVKADEYALVSHKKLQKEAKREGETTREDKDEYDVGLVITHDNPKGLLQSESEMMTLRLKYFIILTRSRDCFPMKTLEKKLGEFRSALTRTSSYGPQEVPSGGDDMSKPVPVKQHLSVRQEDVNYLGFSNVHQAPIYDMVQNEVQAGRDKIEQMVQLSRVKCSLDYLWKRMLSKEGDIRKKKRSETEESRDGSLKSLSFDEFKELLRMVALTPLSEIDAQLIPFMNMSFAWYYSLLDVLISRYPDTHRCFVSTDNQQKYILVLNPNYLDMFMMMSLDFRLERAELCMVLREPLLNKEHTPLSPNLPVLSMQTHIESFVNACVFHTWASML
ncbi:KICSTOR complex protein SZT2-like isoform X2 [Gigantopelta aegis]|uniref:KICSTOR complex protein SZT2-like isoform X2 n=1 Tax=Gigantopelta aegis TaxID=1735272 RepID=UPI001B88B4A8|nr:KICSTOR complex protein SZT2-like isoform X2 [Gigantopelta aegis]